MDKRIATKRNIIDGSLVCLIWLSSLVTVGVLVWILSYILINGITHITPQFLFTIPKGHEGGILPMILNTLYIVFFTVLISTPIGICSAIYMVEYAKPGIAVRIIRFATESLAGIPSIIYGLFGYIFFVTACHLKFSILSGALTLSIMVLPTIIRTTEEALKSVPDTFREGSLGLGASKLRTVFRIILPSAITGIMTAVILSIGRIVGETAAVYLTAGTVQRLFFINSPDDLINNGGKTLAVHLYILAKEGISFEKSYATATVLVIMVAIINLSANLVAKRFKRI